MFFYVCYVLKSILFYYELMKYFLELCCKCVLFDVEGMVIVLLAVLELFVVVLKLLKIL